jgi:hypothetical protein
MVEYRELGPGDYEAVQELFAKRQSWMAMDGVPAIAGTWSLRNYWLNPSQPAWKLKGAFAEGVLVCTHGTYWSTDLPYAYNSKLCSIETAPVGRLPTAFLHFYNEMLEDVIDRDYLGFLSLVTPRLNRIYDRALVRQSNLNGRFRMREGRRIPANKLSGVEHIDLHLLNLTPAPFDTLVRETLCVQ